MSTIELIPGIGPKKAEELKKKGVTAINDLYLLPNFSKLPIESKLFLIYKPELQIPRVFIKKIEELFKHNNIKGIITGSYRRNKKFSKDIDFISFISSKKLLTILFKLDIKLYIHSEGNDKIGAILEIFNKRVRIDIWFPIKEERVFYLFYTTGNATFNIITRQLVKKKGYLLNRHGLFKKSGDNLIRVKNIKSEHDIFNFIGKPYLNPNERDY